MATKVDIWMPLYVADYLADTSRLTTEQHGAYLLLLMDYWRNGALPDDDAILGQITRMRPDAWSNARSTLQAFFEQCDGKWMHKRVEAEIAKAKAEKEANHARAKAGAEARWAKNASSNASSNARAVLEQCPSPSPSPSPSSKPAPSPAELGLQATCREVWKSYAAAYAGRYGVAPIRNVKVNSLVRQFAKLVPAEEAPAIAAHYIAHNGQFYVAKLHPLELLVADAAKLRTEWATGTQMTSTRARQEERTSSMLSIVEEIKRERGQA